MRTVWLAAVSLLALAGSARADVLEFSVDSTDLSAALPALVERHDEPAGLLAIETNSRIGLEKGDLVRAINGQSATRLSMLSNGGALYYLDVTRGTQPLVIRIAVTLRGAEDSMSRDRYRDGVQQLQRFGPDLTTRTNHTFTQLTEAGAPSGVMVRSSWSGLGILNEGDVIRIVDGEPIRTIEQALDAFARGKARQQIAITVERLGQTLVTTLRINDSLMPDPMIATTQTGLRTAMTSREDRADPAPVGATPRTQIALSLGGFERARSSRENDVPRLAPLTKVSPAVAMAGELGALLGSH